MADRIDVLLEMLKETNAHIHAISEVMGKFPCSETQQRITALEGSMKTSFRCLEDLKNAPDKKFQRFASTINLILMLVNLAIILKIKVMI